MAWNFRRRRSASGLWAFIAQNPALALLVVAGGVLLGISKTQTELSLGLSGVADDLTASVMELVAGPANEGKRWIDGAGTFFSVYEENQRLRDENAKLRQAQSEVAELQRKVERYEQLLKVPTEAPVSGVAGRVIADMSGPFLRTILVNAGSDQGVLKGQAVVAFVTLKSGIEGTPALQKELREHVGKVIGAIAKPDQIRFTDALPKTRSGKIMRQDIESRA
jgi:hypothetical protein